MARLTLPTLLSTKSTSKISSISSTARSTESKRKFYQKLRPSNTMDKPTRQNATMVCVATTCTTSWTPMSRTLTTRAPTTNATTAMTVTKPTVASHSKTFLLPKSIYPVSQRTRTAPSA